MSDPGSQRPVARTPATGDPRTRGAAMSDPGSQRPVARTPATGDPRTRGAR
jgi:hypothetical protein